MDFKELQTLKVRIINSGIPRKEMAEKLGVSYSLLSNYLGGFLRMPDEIRQELNRILESEEIWWGL